MNSETLLKLMESVPFAENDLTLNKQGIISEPQQKRIKRKLLIEFAVFGSLIIWSLIVFAIFFPGNIQIFGAAAFLFFAALVIWTIFLVRQVNRHEGVKMIEGEPDYKIGYTGENSTIPVYIIKIGKLEFNVEEAIFDAFSGKQIRVYYFQIPKKIILSVEIL